MEHLRITFWAAPLKPRGLASMVIVREVRLDRLDDPEEAFELAEIDAERGLPSGWMIEDWKIEECKRAPTVANRRPRGLPKVGEWEPLGQRRARRAIS